MPWTLDSSPPPEGIPAVSQVLVAVSPSLPGSWDGEQEGRAVVKSLMCHAVDRNFLKKALCGITTVPGRLPEFHAHSFIPFVEFNHSDHEQPWLSPRDTKESCS